MKNKASCRVAARNLLLLVVLLLAIAQTACLHDNEYQVIGSGDAAFPLDETIDYYGVVTGSEVKEKFNDDKYQGLVTSSELSMLDQIRSVPDMNSPIKLEVVGHCYKLRATNLETNSIDIEFYSFKNLGKDYFLASESKDGCFEAGVKAKHRLFLLRIQDQDNEVIAVADRKSDNGGDFEDMFERWAHERNMLVKWWHGISSEAKIVKNYKDEDVEQLSVVIEKASAYESFVDSIKNDLLAEIVVFTHKNVEQGKWVHELITRVEKSADEREALINNL